MTPPSPKTSPPEAGQAAPNYPPGPPAGSSGPGPSYPIGPPSSSYSSDWLAGTGSTDGLAVIGSADGPWATTAIGPPRPAFAEVALGGGLLLICLGLHIGAMFPPYPGLPANPVVSSSWEIAVYVCLEIGWALAAVLVLTRISVPGGAALGAGLGAVELGLLAVDIANGFQVSDGSEAGAWLALAGLGFGAAGVLVTASTVPLGAPRVPQRRSALFMLLATFAVVLSYLPSWDKWTAVAPSLHASGSVTEGNAFSQPAVVMAAVLLTVLGFAFVAVLGSVWYPLTVGAWATAGAVIALSSQLISAIYQLSEPVPSTAFGVSAAQARSVGLKISTSLTGWWDADVAATVLLAFLALSAALSARKTTTAAAELTPPPGLFGNGSTDGASDDWPASRHWPGA
ncbi:MAG TPA: hypothetical protein VMS00_04085 [Acidimicrobiales bacterium]|nr:hypothetical protein [Acidimicrobiales bacterium]